MSVNLQSLLSECAANHGNEICITYCDHKVVNTTQSTGAHRASTSQSPENCGASNATDSDIRQNSASDLDPSRFYTEMQMTYSVFWSRVQLISELLSHYQVNLQVIGVFLKEDINLPIVLSGIICSNNAFCPLHLEVSKYTAAAIRKAGVSHVLGHQTLATALTDMLDSSSFTWRRLWHPSKDKDIPPVFATMGLQFLQLLTTSETVTAMEVEETTPSTPLTPLTPSSWPHHLARLAYCITTSGSTGRPKVVRVSHDSIVPNILQLGEMFNLGPSDRVLLTSPLTFDPSIVDIFMTLTRGACLVIVPREVKRRPDLLLEVIVKTQVTCIQATPSLMRMFPTQSLVTSLLGRGTSLRVLALGGEGFPSVEELARWIHPDNQVTCLYNLYGITELSCWAACCKVGVVGEAAPANLAQPVPIGRPLHQTLIKLDIHGNSESEFADRGDNVGEILIGNADRLCLVDDETLDAIIGDGGGLRNPDEDREIVWRKSGDIGRLLEDGSIVCEGRCDDQIKRLGSRMDLGGLAQVCKELPWVRNCKAIFHDNLVAVFVVVDPTVTVARQQHVATTLWAKVKSGNNTLLPQPPTSTMEHSGLPDKKYIADNSNDIKIDSSALPTQEVLDPITGLPDDVIEAEILSHVSQSLPSWYRPDRVVVMRTPLPVNPNGKVDVQSLQRMAAEAPTCTLQGCTKTQSESGVNILELAKQLWMSHLPSGVSEISQTDTFINLGGDSLAMTHLVNTLEGWTQRCKAATHTDKHADNTPPTQQISKSLDKLTQVNKDTGTTQLYEHTIDTPTHIDKLMTNTHKDKYDVSNTPQQINKHIITTPAHISNTPTHFDWLDHLISKDFSFFVSQLELMMKSGKHGFVLSERFNGSTKIDNNYKDNTTATSAFGSETVRQKRGIGRNDSDLSESYSKRKQKKIEERSRSVNTSSSVVAGNEEDCRNMEDRRNGHSISSPHHVTDEITSSPQAENSHLQTNATESFRSCQIHHHNTLSTSHSNIYDLDTPLKMVGRGNRQVRLFNYLDKSNISAGKSSLDKCRKHSRLRVENSNAVSSSKDSNFLVSNAKLAGNLIDPVSKSSIDTENPKHGSEATTSTTVAQTNSKPLSSKDDKSTDSRLKLRWKYDTRKCVDASPVLLVCRGKTFAFIGSHSGMFCGLDVDTGRELWSLTLPDRIEASACCSLDGQFVVVGCFDGVMYTVEALTGRVAWRFSTGDVVKCGPVVSRSTGHLVCSSHDGNVYCLDLKALQCVWSQCVDGGPVFSSPVIDEGSQTVFVASLRGTLLALCQDSGSVKWRYKLDKPVFSSLCLLEDSTGVLVGCVDQCLYCLTSKGQLMWKFATCGPIFSSPTVTATHIYLASHDEHVYCLTTCGQLVWKHCMGSTVYASVFVYELATAASSGPMLCSTKNAETCWNDDADRWCADDTSSSPSCVLAVCSTDGTTHILDCTTGEEVSSVRLPGQLFSSPVATQGKLVVGCRDNFVYCFDVLLPK